MDFMTQAEAKGAVKKLVEKYEEVLNSGQVKKYTEEETKKDFILPLFAALGWNTEDKREVSAEENIKSGGRVDYGFYVNGIPKLYLEAKRFAADLDDPDYAKQAIRYSWNKSVTYSVLTDFENIKLYNAKIVSDALIHKLIFNVSYREFIEEFEKLRLLSKESLNNGDLDKYAESIGKKYRKISVTDKLSEDLNKCRAILAEGFISWNKDKASSELIDEGVQKLLNRLVFIKVLEDREIEPPIIMPLLNEWKSAKREKPTPLYQSMISKFRELDKIYNSNVFDEHPFEGWDDIENATEKVIDILYSKSKSSEFEYDFKIIPADVLGAVYENYLGYKLEKSKKELSGEGDKKRKEHGIYYTPAFIVDYIVENALGPVLKNCHSLTDLKKIKVLDPACGSGSFLVKAANIILRRYEELDRTLAGDKFRRAMTKVMILGDNLYGVDLDQQAVEICRLNLLTNAAEKKQLLPSLSNNIKNGNSLISGSDKELEKYFGKNWRDKKPFNWEEEFPEVFKQGGFDVIVGNPPYVFARGQNFNDDEKKYYYAHFKLQEYQINTFLLFIERGYTLLKKDGFFGYIIPNNWLTINSFAKLREFLLKNTAGLKIINAVDTVFGHASVDTCLLLFEKQQPNFVETGELKDGKFSFLVKHQPEDFFRQDFIIKIAPLETTNKSWDKMFEKCKLLQDVATVSTGLKAYQIGKGKPEQTEKVKKERQFHSQKQIDKTYLPYLEGVDVKRYELGWSGEYLSYGDWLAEPRKSVPFQGARILVRQIPSPYPHCVDGVFTSEKYLNDINSMVIFEPVKEYDLKYILSIINSKLISHWFVRAFDKFQRKIFPQFKVNELARFPIFPATEAEQKKLILLVDKIMKLKNELRISSENSNEWLKIKEEIEKTDRQIDEEVYKLYGLTEEEVKVVEDKN